MNDQRRQLLQDTGLLLLRLSAGAFMAFGHGLGKLTSFADKSETFPDPLGIGSAMSLALAVGAEFFGALLVMAGAATRAAAVPVVITMLVAAFVIHGDDPWSKKEFALVYGVCFAALAFTGAGRFSVDEWWRRRRDPAAPQS